MRCVWENKKRKRSIGLWWGGNCGQSGENGRVKERMRGGGGERERRRM